jgi:hypothetical protein
LQEKFIFEYPKPHNAMKNLPFPLQKPPLKDFLKHPFPSHPDGLIKIMHHRGVSLRCRANLLEHHASKTKEIYTRGSIRKMEKIKNRQDHFF